MSQHCLIQIRKVCDFSNLQLTDITLYPGADKRCVAKTTVSTWSATYDTVGKNQGNQNAALVFD